MATTGAYDTPRATAIIAQRGRGLQMDRIAVKDQTTDSGGDATAFTRIVNGNVLSIQYVKDDYAAGVDFTITRETTGQQI